MIHRPIALVTGATRGIGRAIADALGSDHHVLVGGRNADAVAAVVDSLPSAEPYVADLTLDPLPPLPPRLDVLVHSAGVEESGPVAEIGREVWERVFAANLFAVAELTRQALPSLRAARGLVVSINSGSGLTSNPGGAVYAASKFALRAFTDALREEERANGVRVSSVHPGRVDTDMQRAKVALEGDDYDTDFYLDAAAVAAVVRTVVDLPPGGTVEAVSVRPTRKR
ncbi:SDR family oxidoreductase [Herbiconiux sp. L3-i23]|uniref:SDR family oxidoreductase n=1 Tax=Herbiconiux sp. L3-i23 TaxID=2905871 RepID=UPI00204F0AE7|nr:SDR family oxidoreductase [Herbiconiux sp. L3-i23]BDI22314.1 short chain dehydrogenase [Herbiconiux sp. L3-i23]